ncbi:hypothetical protein ANCCEY_02662 [Ancylostoma ceylanicum]|uniref:Reverse transcriptase domain-containing protein n=1 Tax=Ancylostoma ceylanicum TaxID=53326 RepID=A0A0D6M482_9BILA|nr:hypothetical protein ANCCEY_02662 [Ancylostoma ceylanicum]
MRKQIAYVKDLNPSTIWLNFNKYFALITLNCQWKSSRTVLVYKKGDPQDIDNYRAFCPLSVVYKLFTRVILNRIERTLDEGQPYEQARFRKGFTTIDHIYTVTRFTVVSGEYKMSHVHRLEEGLPQR